MTSIDTDYISMGRILVRELLRAHGEPTYLEHEELQAAHVRNSE